MIVYQCAKCEVVLGHFDNGEKKIRVSHGLCRKDFLEFAVESGIETPEEKMEWEGLTNVVR